MERDSELTVSCIALLMTPARLELYCIHEVKGIPHFTL